VSVLLGNGDGTFQAAVRYDVGPSPSSVTVGDFNGDGKLDLVAANSGSNDVSVLLGNGDGTLQAAVTYSVGPVGTSPFSVMSGDFNGDGTLDLVAANTGSNNVSVLLGNGDGTFQAAVSYPAGSGPRSVTSGDFNGDGKLDLAVTWASQSGASSGVSVLLGNGDGTFQAAVSYSVGPFGTSTPFSVTTGDFNGDENLDLVTANNSNSVSVLLGNGDGTFQAAVRYPAGDGPRSVTTGDFNGDGKLDLAVANERSNNVSVLLGNGDGTFLSAVNYSVGTSPSSLTSGDFNGDGKPDPVVANLYSHTVSALLGMGDGIFQPAVSYGVGPNPSSVTGGDLNGDGKLDLVTVNSDNNSVSVLLGNGDGTFQTAVSYVTGASSSPPAGRSSVTSGDLNGDGKLDLVTANSRDNNVSILLNSGCLP